jgi:hypothetical protein
MDWQDGIEVVKPYVVKITTPRGSGTGFYFSDAGQPGICAIATAGHVIDFEHYWRQPVSITHFESGKSTFLEAAKRAVFIKTEEDTAAVVCAKADLPFPEKLLRLTPKDQNLKLGNEIGWLGFPALSSQNLCFFSGRTSCWVQATRAYLVDGVAIHGVSGGPAFHLDPDDDLTIVGIVSAYMPNRATGESLPGLCVIRDVTLLQGLVEQFKSMKEAKEKEAETPVAPPPPAPQDSTRESGRGA